MFDNHAPDFKAGDDLHRIDSGRGGFSSGLHQAAYLFQQEVTGMVVRACPGCPGTGLIRVHCLPSSSQFLQQAVAKFGIGGGMSETACFTFARSG
jgi:hypothetical protein